MKLFRSDQIRQIDEFTIEQEPVASIDLMERAAWQMLKWYISRFERSRRIFIFAGPGNNGGDGLALARLLESERYEPQVCYVKFTEKTSEDWNKNKLRLTSETKVPFMEIVSSSQFPVISPQDIIIDAVFGTGLARKVEGLAKDVIKLINQADAQVISIDIPSGMFGEDNGPNDYEGVVSADYTLSFQFPKLSFMFSENEKYLGEWVVLPIGLSSKAISNTNSPYTFLEKKDVAPLLKRRNKFDHKGTFGHCLLFAGSYGKMGAAVLGAKAALRTGTGLITCHIPLSGVLIVQSALPEAMVEPDSNEKHLSEIGKPDEYSAVGIGPGIGTESESQRALYKLLEECRKPMVIDADALNILSLNKNWFSLIPPGTILTPHPKEFERLIGETRNGYSRLEKQIEFSEEHKCLIVLKGANTSITSPEGKVFFNSTGNPGMATAGSGDVLTGILLSLLAQGYKPEDAAITGVYLHGLAGDIASAELCQESIIASDIIKSIGKAFNKIKGLPRPPASGSQ
jgi:ADP-dependent NAD(P)H-hydrate dehydratase / NAD(P)H-hydrate epimerase